MSVLTGDNATKTRAGNLRIATDAEATAGTLENVAVNPKQLVANVSAVVGGLVYRGVYNATTPNVDLTQANKGDFYKVSVAGTLATVSLNVGDHLVFNQDASNPVTSSVFDVIDNTDAVIRVNGLTGDVTLEAGDVSALAIANNLSDLNNVVTARSNLGLGTVAVEDVGTGANNIVQLDGSSRLPAVDGSQLTNVNATASKPLIRTPTGTTTIGTYTGIEEIILVNNLATAATITLPTAGTVGSGYKYNIKRLGTATVTVSSTSNIDGGSFTLNLTNQSVTVVSDGSTYYII